MTRPLVIPLPPGPHGPPVIYVCAGCLRQSAGYEHVAPKRWVTNGVRWHCPKCRGTR